MRVVLVLVLGVAVLAACSDESAPSCEKTVEAVNRSLGSSSADKLAMCKDERWSPALRNCLVGAREEADATRCFARHRGLKAMTKKPAAEAQLQRIGAAIKSYYVENAGLPSPAGPTPSEPCCGSGAAGKCPPDPALWAAPPWSDLGFEIDEAHAFRYAIDSVGADELVVRAIGDLDCDGEEVTYELRVTVAAGNVQTSITAPTNAD